MPQKQLIEFSDEELQIILKWYELFESENNSEDEDFELVSKLRTYLRD